ncbi:LysR family transcriptional regulator [Desulfoluna butyratoxydans]|uniref:Transcription regulator hth lysr n=1 Tax=Desulfoluna butyratoxydans TaxID=231438 RepID=A0A4U8YL70_9BACT|nr:LysR family transcriptional regulator [Desulfoluna butyratoxydans]VFQ44666.1 transcription regulator hth lysr [Desulfoluna butyratoxydans]
MESAERIFLRVVEAGSFKAAAEQLGTDPSAVSRKVMALEERLGVKLLQRSPRRSTPTETGLLYYEGMRRLVDEQSTLESRVSSVADTAQGLLRVSAPLEFGQAFVVPVLKDMVKQYPELRVELRFNSGYAEAPTAHFDVEIHVGDLPDSNLMCKKLADMPMILVASRGYLETHPPPQTAQDLKHHHFLLFSKQQRELPLELHRQEKRERVYVTDGKFTVNSLTAIRDLVVEGFGIALAPMWPYRGLLETGEVVRLLEGYQLSPYPWYALYPGAAFVPAKTRRFLDLLGQIEFEFDHR